MTKELKHLLLVTTEDPFSMRAWSGIPYSLRTALEGMVERVTTFRPGPPPRVQIGLVKRVLLGAERYPLWMTKATLKANARAVRKEIARVKPDAVLSISSQCVAYLDRPGVPVFLFSDAPYKAFSETYARWDPPPLRIGEFTAEEAVAGRRMDGLCFGSQWACREAKRLYGLEDEAKLHVTPLGANWVPAEGREEILARIDERVGRLAEEIELLFVGRDWERKGGALAVEVAAKLRAAGRRVRLHVVGCRPELGEAAGPDGFVTVHGPLYQGDPEQSARLAELFLRSHFLIVPTLAECFGIAFAEAQGFGLPPVSRAVDAVPSIVRDGETGMLFGRDAGAEVYAERLVELVERPEEYRAMARRARAWFEEGLTWERTAEGIMAAMRGSEIRG
jgi:glycosyltransferase involved in cell wall biosynthesis